jgi:hypothetical protein
MLQYNGSKQNSPQIKDGTLQSGKYDGPSDEFITRTTNSTISSSNGSPDMAEKYHHGALRYAIHQNLNPYFQNQHIAIGASPAESPLNGPSSISRRILSPASSVTPTAGTSSPTPTTGGFSPFAGTSPNFVVDTHPFHIQDRFPFTADAHTSSAIRS